MTRKPRFYYRTTRGRPPRRLAVRSLGINELMEPCWIRHGGTGGPYLFIHFQSPAYLREAGEQRPMGGRTIFWPVGARHHYGHPTKKWLHSWISIAGDAVGEALAAEGVPLGRVVTVDGEAVFIKYLRALHDELHRHAEPDPIILEGVVRLWMREVGRATRETGQARALPQRLVEVRSFLDAHFHERLRLTDLAERAHLSVSQFCAVFKKHLGVSPLHYALSMRMRRAELLLGDMNLAVYEVAQRVGFEDPLYFSKQFRKHYGVSPRQYRRRHGLL